MSIGNTINRSQNSANFDKTDIYYYTSRHIIFLIIILTIAMIHHIYQIHRKLISHPVVQNINQHLHKHLIVWFTLIEVLIVTSVVGILATATTTKISNQQESARNIARKAMVWQLASAITTFYSNNRYRPSGLGALTNYINTIPTDPKKLDTCHTAASTNGQYGYLRYTGGWLSGDKDGFMVFSQLERGGRWIEFSKMYVLTWSDPCQNSASGNPALVDWFRIANSVCTSKPWRITNNPWWTWPLALTTNQKGIIDIFGNQKAYASYGGNGGNSWSWVWKTASDLDGDLTPNSSEPNTAASTNPCIPDTFARNCDLDTDEDGVTDVVEKETTDTDGDGVPDYMESLTKDTDGDSIWDQYDDGRPSCNGQAATIYISTIINGNRYIIWWANNLSIYAWTIPEANGGAVIVWSDGDDIINGWNGVDIICGWSGNDTINGWNAADSYSCWPGTDTTLSSNGTDVCSTDCEWNAWCDNMSSTIVGVAYPPSANTANCNLVTTPISWDADADTYVSATWVTSNYGNADSNNSNFCLPNSLTDRCTSKTTFIGWTCFDNDNDGHFNNVYHITYLPAPSSGSLSWDPQDQNPCIPDNSTQWCTAISDNDKDGYRTNVVSTDPLFDPNDNNPCIPKIFWAWCNLDTDGDGKTNFQEWEFTNTDAFFKYPTTLGFDIYSGAYATIINQWWRTEIATGDNLYNRQEADKNTTVFPNADPDWDWVFNELDPDNSNSCIPSNFGTGCTLDFDGDGRSDSQEGSSANTDTTWWYVADAYPDWIESFISTATTYWWLSNPSWLNSDPDSDNIMNQLDPNNSNKCIPNTGADASCAWTLPPPPLSAIQWVNCASMTSLPPWARLYYIYTY